MIAMMPLKSMLFALAFLLALPAAAQEKSDADKVGDTAKNMATKPLKDLNLLRDEVPPELLEVMNNPYSLAGLKTCRQMSAEIARMTSVLGPDVDAVQAKSGETATEAVLGTAESVVGSLIPGAGIMRRLSGADAAQRKAQAAVFAGSLRRAYLKGRAGGRGCKI